MQAIVVHHMPVPHASHSDMNEPLQVREWLAHDTNGLIAFHQLATDHPESPRHTPHRPLTIEYPNKNGKLEPVRLTIQSCWQSTPKITPNGGYFNIKHRMGITP